MKTGSLILVSMIRPAQLEQTFRRKRLEWPLHVTLVPWFQIQDAPRFITRLGEFTASKQEFTSTIGTDELFGADRDVPVSLFSDSAELTLLHNELITFVESQGARFGAEGQYIKDAYRPHVTQHGQSRLHEGDDVEVSAITVVRLLDDDVCEVVATVPLGEAKT